MLLIHNTPLELTLTATNGQTVTLIHALGNVPSKDYTIDARICRYVYLVLCTLHTIEVHVHAGLEHSFTHYTQSQYTAHQFLFG